MKVSAALPALLAVFACGQEAPTELEELRRGLNLSAAEVSAEEEILGGVYSNDTVPSSSTMWVRLVPLPGGAALRDANGNPSSSDRMPIKLKGSRYPAKTTPDGQWGWYDPVAADGPCRPNAPNKNEVHDLNQNGIPDGDQGGGIEKHCARAGSYRVELLSSQFGSVVASREIDKVRVNGSISSGGGLKGIEDPTLASGGGSNVADVFVHFDIGGNSYGVSGTYKIDNASTSAVNDTVGRTTDTFRFDAQHTTTWPGTTRGELMAKYSWGNGSVSRFANTDQVIRVNKYGTPQTYSVRADVIQPRGLGITGQLRKVVVQAPVASVTVSPSSATITTQNGTVTLTATLQDANGNILTGREVSWSSSNTTVASVSGSGTSATVTGTANGTATITATSEGQSGTSTITVNFPTGTDGAAANGNTFPSSMSAGGIVSVTLSMTNTGTTTWTAADGYQLVLIRNVDAWLPIVRSLSSSVGPGASTTFAFDLRHFEPEITGSVPAFYGMEHGTTVFGAENGRNISIAGPKGGALAAFTATATQSLSAQTVAEWVANAEDAGTSSLPITPDALRANAAVILEYTYDHATSRALDIVLKFTFDPQLIEALPVEPAEGAVDLVVQAGVVAPGEYWVRLTGTVPAGQGLIAGLPFRLVAGDKLPRNQELGTLTIYYPGAN